MLEHLFGSKTRVKLLQLFLNNPSQPFYLRELARRLKMQLNSVRREVENLEKFGILKTVQLVNAEKPAEAVDEKSKEKKSKKKSAAQESMKKYFLVNTDFLLFSELKALLLKSQLLLERTFVSRIERLPKLKFFVLTGSFVGLEAFPTDMLIIGSVNRVTLANLVKKFEKELGRTVNYTVLTEAEYKYRKSITDRFLYDILESKKLTIVNKLS